MKVQHVVSYTSVTEFHHSSALTVRFFSQSFRSSRIANGRNTTAPSEPITPVRTNETTRSYRLSPGSSVHPKLMLDESMLQDDGHDSQTEGGYHGQRDIAHAAFSFEDVTASGSNSNSSEQAVHQDILTAADDTPPRRPLPPPRSKSINIQDAPEVAYRRVSRFTEAPSTVSPARSRRTASPPPPPAVKNNLLKRVVRQVKLVVGLKRKTLLPRFNSSVFSFGTTGSVQKVPRPPAAEASAVNTEESTTAAGAPGERKVGEWLEKHDQNEQEDPDGVGPSTKPKKRFWKK